MTIQETFQLAYQHHRAGRRDLAEPIYRKIISQQPDHVDALYSLGVLLLETGRVSEAIGLLRQATKIRPAADYRVALGMALPADVGIAPDRCLQICTKYQKSLPGYVVRLVKNRDLTVSRDIAFLTKSD